MKTVLSLVFAVIATAAFSQTDPVEPVKAAPPATPKAPSGGARTVVARPAPAMAGYGMPYRSSRSSVPPVVVRFTSAEPEVVQEISEDLDVMTLLIDQALSDDSTSGKASSRMGIELFYTSSGRSVRALYVEDFGAVFMVKVNFPLHGAPPPKEKEPTKAADSEWERARREVLGLENPEDSRDSSADYVFDPEKVEALKKALVGALKNGSNIRHLKKDDAISISVFGHPSTTAKTASASPAPEAKRSRVAVAAPGGSRPVEVVLQDRLQSIVSRVPSYRDGTVLTLRAKKSDVDAFAKGDLSTDTFTRKVSFNSYIGAGHDITSVNSWIKDQPSVR